MPFEFYSVPRIVFGQGQFARIAELCAPLGKRALIVHNADALIDRLTAQLTSAQIDPHFVRQRGEPKVSDIDRALEQARELNVDLIVGAGGGSAIDAAKAVAGLFSNGGSALDYMEVVGKGQKITRPAVPWIAIPTTAGTGAEATRNAVIGFPEKRFKASIRSELLLPRIALIDPELGISVPPDVTARSGMDALCQLIESYTSSGAQPLTDGLALEAIALACRSLERAYCKGSDIEARSDMALAALMSGITLTNVGLGAVHGFAAPMGASFPIPHGTICAALLPHVITANVTAARAQSPTHPTLARYARIGRTMASRQDLSEPAAIDACERFTGELTAALRIPALSSFGLSEAAFPGLIALARQSSSMRYNPVKLSDEALSGILRKSLGQPGVLKHTLQD